MGHISSRTDRNFVFKDDISLDTKVLVKFRKSSGSALVEVCALDPNALVVHKTVDKTQNSSN